MPRLLADRWTRTIVQALADGPLRPSELERLPGIARITLYARLGELTTLGVLAAHRITEFPLRVEYILNETGRRTLANELLIERQGRRRLARAGPGAEAALGNLLRFLAPVSRLAPDYRGVCVVVEHEPPGRTHAVLLHVEGGRIAVSECAGPSPPDAHVRAVPEAWDNALLTGRTTGLRIMHDGGLACAIVAAFSAALGG